MEDQILTPHFRLSEFTRSATAIAKSIDNSVPARYIPSLKSLCIQVLEPLRAQVNEPIVISSGYRCGELNKAVGGVTNSQHTIGEACDIYLPDKKKLHEWFLLLEDGEFDQLIMERSSSKGSHNWIHVSCKPDLSKNRHQVLRRIAK